MANDHPPRVDEPETLMDQATAAAPAPQARRHGSVVNDVLEWAGLALLVACAAVIWPPAALGVAGLILVVMANMRQVQADTRPAGHGRLMRLALAAAAYRDAGGGR